MSDLSCPHCGRVGSVPKDKEHSRLVCKKCHGVFHVNALGKTHIGEPPASKDLAKTPRDRSMEEGSTEETAPFWSLGEMTPSRKRWLLGLGGLVVALGCWLILTEKPESLEVRAVKAAKALTAENLTALERFAKPGSEEYVRKWVDSIKPHLQDMKNASLTSAVKANVLVTQEDSADGFGQVTFYLSPAGITARIGEQEGSTGSRRYSEYVVAWSREPSGRWVLDGQSTLQRLVAAR